MDIALQRIQRYDPKKDTILDLSQLGLTQLPKLPDLVFNLDCSHNELTDLGSLPSTLKDLNCMYNKLSQIKNLPHYLDILDCSNNELTKLELPFGLKRLYCYHNKLEHLELPMFVEGVNCHYNRLRELDASQTPLLRILTCSDNKLIRIKLPSHQLYHLYVANNPYLTIDAETAYRYCIVNPSDYHKTMQPLKQMYRTIHNPDIVYAPDGRHYKKMRIKYQGVFSDL